MPKFVSIDKSGKMKTHTIDVDFPMSEIYRKIGFKTAEGFERQIAWSWSNNAGSLVLMGKTKGRSGQTNQFVFPSPANMMSFYGSCAILNLSADSETVGDIDSEQLAEFFANVNKPTAQSVAVEETAPQTEPRAKKRAQAKRVEEVHDVPILTCSDELVEEDYV